MAEKTKEEKAPSSSENLTCPLCLDIFDEATILTSCGHTFCRKCLKNYDLSHQDLDHMICPLCRKITKLSANRVDDFLTNVTVNGLVDNYHAKCGGMNADLEMRPKCTACRFQQEAVSFCCTCNNYICDRCLDCHQFLKSMKITRLYPYRISTTGRSILVIYLRSAASTNKRTKICFVRL